MFNKENNIEEEIKNQEGMSRRSFLVGTGTVLAGTAIGGGLLAGCKGETTTTTKTVEVPTTKTVSTTVEIPTTVTTEGPVSTVTTTKTVTGTGGETTVTTTVTSGGYSFEVSPDPIPDKDIIETATADVIVVGCGVAGSAAAVAAAEQGASVIVLEAYEKAASGGGVYGAINSTVQIEGGNVTDVEPLVTSLVDESIGRADTRLLHKWATNSGTSMDWRIGLLDKMNSLAGFERYTYGMMGTAAFMFRDSEDTDEGKDIRMLIPYLESLGGAVRHNTRGIQLVREDNNGTGRVVGVIATNADGNYCKFIANKAVVLAAGGFEYAKELMAKYCSWANHDLICFALQGTAKGDGHKMALWAGIDLTPAPYCPMMHFNGTNQSTVMKTIVSGDYMYVNKVGERFMNEGMSQEKRANIVLAQPDYTSFKIFDSKAITDANNAAVEEGLLTGEILKGNTIEELASAMGARADLLTENINRWNELIANGIDTDFGKDLSKCTSLDTPPYYTEERPPNLLTIGGGLRINTNMQVLDANRNIVSGLYAAGNCISGLYGDSYPMEVFSGIARGCAMTFGQLAGVNAATE